MKCSNARKMMIDYMDDQLMGDKTVAIEKHLAVCPQCREVLGEMTDIVTMARVLQTVEAPEGAWPKIEMKMAARRQRPLLEIMRRLIETLLLHRRLAVTAALAVCLIGLVSIFQQRISLTDPGTEGAVDVAAIHHFQEAERHYQLAIEAINQSLPDIETQLPPELAADLQKNLKIIDDAILVCRAVIDRYPENALANEQLLVCYKKKFELLNEIQWML